MNLISFGLNHLNQFLFWYNWSVCFYFYYMFLLYILYIIHILKYIVPYYQKSLVFPFFLKLFILTFNSFSTFKSLISDARWFIDLLDLPWRNHQIHCSNRLIFVKCKFRVLYVFFFLPLHNTFNSTYYVLRLHVISLWKSSSRFLFSFRIGRWSLFSLLIMPSFLSHLTCGHPRRIYTSHIDGVKWLRWIKGCGL